MRNPLHVCSAIMLCSLAWGQAQPAQKPAAGSQSMPGMDMPGDAHSGMNMDSDKGEGSAEAHAMHSMEGHMDMGPHMKMTALRTAKPGDAERAAKVVEEARKATEKYQDYHAALADGFKIFLPNVPQPMYHFSNYKYGAEAKSHFNPDHPTSLLYEKHGDDYKLVGVMYTAPRSFSEDDLDQRIPLSVARWHEHVNFCLPPFGHWREELSRPDPKFGMKGSIATQDACDEAGGKFLPVVLNWMVHIYPFEKDPANIWSVDRRHGDAD
ncbi:MAG TPA: hypothetical protein VKV39_16015 [Candidatus Sulfotelmatobacter sp.]|nr:hypothetical protein [Candidatus Sulfotelmatobacter sp.]